MKPVLMHLFFFSYFHSSLCFSIYLCDAVDQPLENYQREYSHFDFFFFIFLYSYYFFILSIFQSLFIFVSKNGGKWWLLVSFRGNTESVANERYDSIVRLIDRTEKDTTACVAYFF